MPKSKEVKEEEQVNSDLDIFLAMELGIFSSLRGKKIRFNPRPFSNPKHIDLSNPKMPDDIKFVDLHIEVAKKVDALIEQMEKETKPELQQTEFVSTKQPIVSLNNIVEVREQFKKQVEPPAFKAEINTSQVFGEFDPRQELFEIEVPTQENSDNCNTIKFEDEQDEEIDTWVDLRKKTVGDHDPKKWLMGLGNIKVRKNGVAKTKEELEKTKAAIEKKKKELEKTKQIAKEKEELLKIKEKEKIQKQKEEEKKKKINQKKKKIEEKQKQKELKIQAKLEAQNKRIAEKKRIQAEKQKKIQDRIKERELKAKEKHKQLADKQKERQLALLNTKKEKQKKLKAKKEVEPKKKATKKTKIGFSFSSKKKKDKKTKKEPVTPTIEEQTKAVKQEPQPKFDEDVSAAITLIDELLEQLPDEVIDDFVQSDNFEIYERVVKKYKK